MHGAVGDRVPALDAAQGRQAAGAVARAIAEGLVRAAHDCSEGGLAAALAEMAFAGEVGARVSLAAVPVSKDVERDDEILFSESQARYVLEVPPANAKALEERLAGLPWAKIGETVETRRLVITGRGGTVAIDEGLEELKKAWQCPLRW
jgi:phosphoribosylformylglycinamidine synthase